MNRMYNIKKFILKIITKTNNKNCKKFENIIINRMEVLYEFN